jgi:hypothetical protein
MYKDFMKKSSESGFYLKKKSDKKIFDIASRN